MREAVIDVFANDKSKQKPSEHIAIFCIFCVLFCITCFFSCIAIHDLPKQIQLALKKTKFLLYV